MWEAEMGNASETLRASDQEREHTAALLREHCRRGRLSVDELSERMSAAFVARTHGELRALLGDLPAQRPAAPDGDFGGHARVFLLVQVSLVAIWLLTGAGYFWPVWPFLGWGIGLAAHALAAGRAGQPRHTKVGGDAPVSSR
jgi:hypothetical protein